MNMQYRPACTSPTSTIFIREYTYLYEFRNNAVTNQRRFDTDNNKKLDLGEVLGTK